MSDLERSLDYYGRVLGLETLDLHYENLVVEAEARNASAHWVTERWLGGTLTNFQTIKKQIKRLRDLEQGVAEGDFENYTKKEQLLFSREREKLSRNLEGLKNMARLPGALSIVVAKKEKIAIQEANRLGIPVVAIVDTNADPDVITVPIPGNDDAIRSVSLITSALCEAVREARSQIPVRDAALDDEAETYSAGEGDGASDDDRRKRRPRRKRKARPEAIAARLKTDSPAPAGGDIYRLSGQTLRRRQRLLSMPRAPAPGPASRAPAW